MIVHHARYIEPTQDYPTLIVGESYYAESFRQLCGDTGDYVEAEHVALLIHNDENPHDDKAIAVYIRGLKVGHLDRSDARLFRRRMQEADADGQPVKCGAMIGGGTSRNHRDEPIFGVKLRFDVAAPIRFIAPPADRDAAAFAAFIRTSRR